jgi:hypothetical protein
MEEPIEATLTWVWRAAGRLSDNESTQRDGLELMMIVILVAAVRELHVWS